MVVVAPLGRVNPALALEGSAEHVLGSGLADGARDADDLGGGPDAGRPPEILERCENVWHNQKGRVRRHAVGPMGHEGRRRPFSERVRHKVVPVPPVLQRDEQVALFQRARVDGDAIGEPRRGRGAAGRTIGLPVRPERGGHRHGRCLRKLELADMLHLFLPPGSSCLSVWQLMVRSRREQRPRSKIVRYRQKDRCPAR